MEENVEKAIHRLRSHQPPEGYHLAFSGGKDSIVVLELAKLAEIRYKAYYCITTVDPPELIYFIRKNYPEVIFLKPNTTMWELIPKKLFPPTRLVRYCCSELKEYAGAGEIVLTGIRWEESTKRAKRRMVETCHKDETKVYVNPIIDWTAWDVWRFIKDNNVPYPSLYDEGFGRIGCIMCPMQGTKGMVRDAMRWPKFYKLYLKAFDRMLAVRRERERETDWQTAQDVMQWWLSPKSEEIEGQMPFDFGEHDTQTLDQIICNDFSPHKTQMRERRGNSITSNQSIPIGVVDDENRR